jgi:TolB-like protein
MSLIAELKRRNVFRVGAAYAIVGWLLIEVASVLLPTFDAPDWVMKAFSSLVILGFPLTLVIAWAFELTPEGIKRDTAVDPADSIRHVTGRRLDFIIIGVLVLAVAYFAVDKFVLESEPEQAGITPKPLPVAESVAREKSIAVLPFVNMSSDPEQEYFSDGLSEEILNLLAKVPELKVTARTSSFAFKGKNDDVRTIGKALNVNAVLEGSVRKSGERVRITAQLIDVASGTHLWSETYDRILTDIFAVQDNVASEILDALQVHVGVAPTRGRPTEDTEAYSLALKAKAALSVYEGDIARSYLLKAIELDPDYAKAHELVAFSYWVGSREIDPTSIRVFSLRERFGKQARMRATRFTRKSKPSNESCVKSRVMGGPEMPWSMTCCLRATLKRPWRSQNALLN